MGFALDYEYVEVRRDDGIGYRMVRRAMQYKKWRMH